MTGDPARVAALYRYPVKGFTPEERTHLTLTADDRADGDRVWSLRFPRGAEPGDRDGRDHWPKGDGLNLRDHPSLARLRLRYDPGAGRITLDLPGAGSREYLVHGGPGAQRFAADVTAALLAAPEGPRLREHLPLRLVGDGQTARFQDRPRGYLTAHSRASLAELADLMGTGVDERRFRSNIAIEGLAPWRERDLIGTPVTIGGVVFDVHAPIVRCLAVNAHPESGERDLRVLQYLTRGLGQDQPTFGVLLLPRPGQEGLRIDVGAEFEVAG